MQPVDVQHLVEEAARALARRVEELTAKSEPAPAEASDAPEEPTPRVDDPRADLRLVIDHTLLKPEVTRADLARHCEEALEHGFYSVCVSSANVAFCKAKLDGSGVKVCAVVGFPHGNASAAAKAAEARQAVRDGADELDMVIALGPLREGDHAAVHADIAGVVAAGAPVKVILETALLGEREKVVGCALAKAAGAAFVKTSTGFGGGGATVEDIELMRSVVGEDVGVKASGGVRDAETADAMIAAGADRIGASSSVAIVTGGAGKSGY